MQFLTPVEWQSWCVKHQVPLREVSWLRPDITEQHFHIVDLEYPADSGRKVCLARLLYSLIPPEPETLILMDDWGVWPSSQHLPLVTRFRQALGERRELVEAPAHLVAASDQDDAVSIIAMSLLFICDCYGISASGANAFFVSHDEHCYFATRDASTVARAKEQLAGFIKQGHSS